MGEHPYLMSKMQDFRIVSNAGLQVELSDYGARILDVQLPTRRGLESVICGYQTTEQYAHDSAYVGATIGPVANRIRNGKLNVAGREIQLPLNQNGHCLHSAVLGFDSQTWVVVDQTSSLLKLRLITQDSLFGEIITIATYSVKATSLRIDFKCTSEKPNYINLTNHAYWNLNTDSSNIQNHEFELHTLGYADKDSDEIPTGDVTRLTSPFKYRSNQTQSDSVIPAAVDHHFFADHETDQLKLHATVFSPQSDISLKVSSTKPGFQLYSGHFLSPPLSPFDGFCVEPQFAPNAINIDGFDSPLTTEDLPYNQSILYQLSEES